MMAAMVSLSGCHSYIGITKHDSGVYLTGTTSFMIFSSSWVRKCKEAGETLKCRELEVEDSDVPIVMERKQRPKHDYYSEATEEAKSAYVAPSRKPKKKVERVKDTVGTLKVMEDFPGEAEGKLGKIQGILTGCRDNYSKGTEAATIKFIVLASGQVKEIQSEQFDVSGQFGTCLQRTLSLVQFPETDSGERVYIKQIRF